MKPILKYILLVLTVLVSISCSTTRKIADDEYLLNAYQIEKNSDEISNEEIRNYLKQKPNKQIFGWKFWLRLNNMAGSKNERGVNRWLKRIGEPPVIYNENLTKNSSKQLELFLFNKGFFDAEVTDSTVFRKKKAKVYYRIDTREPYTIRNIDYFFEDASLSKFIINDSLPSLLNIGDRFDVNIMENERLRIETILRNKGYYNFSKNYIQFDADSSLGSQEVDLTLNIRNYPVKDARGRVTRTRHPVYEIRDVYLKTGSDQVTPGSTSVFSASDTLVYDKVHIITRADVNINPKMITQFNYILPGEKYSARKVQRTYRNLTSLSALRMVDINFQEVEGEENLLDCELRMLPAIRQAFTGGIEGTNSGGNIGMAGNLSYQHRNLFGGSEKFDLIFTGAIEDIPENKVVETSERAFSTSQELGVEAKLYLPKFFLPFRSDQFIRKFNPQTSINFSFNYQRRPDYIRSRFKGTFGYQWKGNGNLRHYLYPVEVSLINMPFIDTAYAALIEGTYLYNSYQPHFITDQSYSLIFSNQKINKESDFQYLRFSVESAGNLMYLLYRATGNNEVDALIPLLNVTYAQYFRTDIDFRHYDYLDEGISIVYRGYIGAAVPYLNSTAIPFEKQYFSGGANSLRAWRVKNLGPGSYTDGYLSKYPNQTADLKIEANVEYRFKLFWKLEGAFFVDVGNIWSLSAEEDREGARFSFSRFYKEFAVGTGIGARFDFNFFVFRFDLGVPLVDPSYPEGERWLPGGAGVDFEDLGFNIAIGYPF